MTVVVPYPTLLSTVTGVFADRGVPPDRARVAARALCHGDLTGVSSHGLVNLTRLYLPLLSSGRADPAADMLVTADLGACVHADARRALGLWSAAQAVDLAAARAARHGVGLVSLRGATHIGCAGFHAARAVEHGMVGLVASNCGGQRIAPPPGGREPLLGTNPLALACPAGERHPFVLDMSTTVVPTGRVRAAAREGREVPPGWLADEAGGPVTDPAAFDRGEARLLWLGGSPETGAYKGFGLGLLVEVLSALVPGAALGPAGGGSAGGGSAGGGSAGGGSAGGGSAGGGSAGGGSTGGGSTGGGSTGGGSTGGGSTGGGSTGGGSTGGGSTGGGSTGGGSTGGGSTGGGSTGGGSTGGGSTGGGSTGGGSTGGGSTGGGSTGGGSTGGGSTGGGSTGGGSTGGGSTAAARRAAARRAAARRVAARRATWRLRLVVGRMTTSGCWPW
ncbi:2,3-diketo-L-gulonate reductase [Actinosynnema sp. ALI-1.44]